MLTGQIVALLFDSGARISLMSHKKAQIDTSTYKENIHTKSINQF
jgi:hypothetical protein